ncbi:hypothetical protein BT67DRAFT_281375 [Trichocladium antarcticum]|uniref:Uncharacterized protein n=1 Tax=Trichocladium antarcticum TaxID=1450529 RepID=A0AAN6ULH0_9PEZI|nr:hypothetical protein BT67DRAFT_281375 [Trichocladium antarcticum]
MAVVACSIPGKKRCENGLLGRTGSFRRGWIEEGRRVVLELYSVRVLEAMVPVGHRGNKRLPGLFKCGPKFWRRCIFGGLGDRDHINHSGSVPGVAAAPKARRARWAQFRAAVRHVGIEQPNDGGEGRGMLEHAPGGRAVPVVGHGGSAARDSVWRTIRYRERKMGKGTR